MTRVESASDAGFTLIELLVAMTLLAMLSVALVASIRYGTRIWKASEAAAATDSSMVAAQSEIQAMVEHLYPEFVNPNPFTGYVLFDGQPDRFTFLTPDETTPGALKRVTVGAGQEGESEELSTTSVSELDAATAPAQTKHVFLRGIEELEISYFGRVKPKDSDSWHPDWRQKTYPPKLVRIRLELSGAGARHWTELVLAPRIAADVSCTFDALTKSCMGR